MKLYRIQASGQWAATQSEARQMAGRGGKFEQVDVPTSGGREALAAFLNELAPRIEAVRLATPEERDIPMEPVGTSHRLPLVISDADRAGPYEHRLEERAALMGTKREVAEIAEQIMDMEGEALGQCALAVASRFKELAQ
jgi:hypothetical protein